MSKIEWEWVSLKRPPAHTRLLFLDDRGKIWEGNMCYGMHEPWFCVRCPSGETLVLGDSGITVRQWALREGL